MECPYDDCKRNNSALESATIMSVLRQAILRGKGIKKIQYVVDVKVGQNIKLEVVSEEESQKAVEQYEVVKIYKYHVLCRRKMKNGGYEKRSVCMGDLIRYGYVREDYN